MINTINLPPFKKMCVTIGNLPTSFMESMSYYEALCWMYNYLDKTVIPAINTEGEAITELQNAFSTLKTYVDDYFENLDVQDEINNKLDAMAESGQLTEIIASYLNTNAIICFNNVNELKTSDSLVNGSFAKTLGYYNINDGGESLYRIRNKIEADNIDDGSIIEISDDLVAELIHDNYISYKQFGAYLDGINDDSLAVKNCHIFANINKLPVIQNNGIMYLKTISPVDPIIIKTNCNLSGMTMKINSTMNSGNIIKVESDNKKTVSLNSTEIATLTKGTNALSQIGLSHNLQNMCVKISSNHVFYTRTTHTGSAVRYAEEVVTFDETCNQIDGTLIHNYNSATVVNLDCISILDNPITIKGLHIEADNANIESLSSIQIHRCNTNIEDFTFDINNKSVVSSGSIYIGEVLNCYGSYGIKLENLIGNNFTGTNNSASGYLVTLNFCSNVTVDRVTFNYGWPLQISSPYCKNVVYNNCNCGRLDNHYGGRNYTVKNCTIIGKLAGFSLGWGDGFVKIQDSTFIHTSNSSKASMLDFREELYQYTGDVIIDNVKIINYTNSAQCIPIKFVPATYDFGVYDTNITFATPHIVCNNLTIEDNNTWNAIKLIYMITNKSDSFIYENNINFNIQDIVFNNVKGNKQFSLQTQFRDSDTKGKISFENINNPFLLNIGIIGDFEFKNCELVYDDNREMNNANTTSPIKINNVIFDNCIVPIHIPPYSSENNVTVNKTIIKNCHIKSLNSNGLIVKGSAISILKDNIITNPSGTFTDVSFDSSSKVFLYNNHYLGKNDISTRTISSSIEDELDNTSTLSWS